jgi:hypothetical protein
MLLSLDYLNSATAGPLPGSATFAADSAKSKAIQACAQSDQFDELKSDIGCRYSIGRLKEEPEHQLQSR